MVEAAESLGCWRGEDGHLLGGSGAEEDVSVLSLQLGSSC